MCSLLKSYYFFGVNLLSLFPQLEYERRTVLYDSYGLPRLYGIAYLAQHASHVSIHRQIGSVQSHDGKRLVFLGIHIYDFVC